MYIHKISALAFLVFFYALIHRRDTHAHAHTHTMCLAGLSVWLSVGRTVLPLAVG